MQYENKFLVKLPCLESAVAVCLLGWKQVYFIFHVWKIQFLHPQFVLLYGFEM